MDLLNALFIMVMAWYLVLSRRAAVVRVFNLPGTIMRGVGVPKTCLFSIISGQLFLSLVILLVCTVAGSKTSLLATPSVTVRVSLTLCRWLPLADLTTTWHLHLCVCATTLLVSLEKQTRPKLGRDNETSFAWLECKP